MHDLNSFKEKRGMICKTLFYVHTKQNIHCKSNLYIYHCADFIFLCTPKFPQNSLICMFITFQHLIYPINHH